jgi:hypothetical protein
MWHISCNEEIVGLATALTLIICKETSIKCPSSQNIKHKLTKHKTLTRFGHLWWPWFRIDFGVPEQNRRKQQKGRPRPSRICAGVVLVSTESRYFRQM